MLTAMEISALPLDTAAPITRGMQPAQVEIVIPVTAHQRDLAKSVPRLHSFLAGPFPFSAHVTIAVAASSRTGQWAITQALAGSYAEVSAVRISAPGRGAALRSVWLTSQSDVLAYLDTDLSIDLAALIPLVEPLLSGTADVAIGTRLASGAQPQHAPRREITSCGYSLLVQAGIGTGFADAQCGCKAITRVSAHDLLPLTSGGSWFLDSELLILAERAGLRIREVPVAGQRADTPGARRHRTVPWRARRRRSHGFRGNAA
jgi:hypothetical protein